MIKTITSDDNSFNIVSLLDTQKYNALFPDNRLSKVWPAGKSLFTIQIIVHVNSPLVDVFGLPDAFELERDDIKDVVFDIDNFLLLGKFYSNIKGIDLTSQERVYFSGMASKLLCFMLEEIQTNIKYIALEASGEDMDFLVDVKYPSLGFQHMMSTDEHLDTLKESEDVPMFAKVKTVMQHCKLHVCSNCRTVGARYYCGCCYEVKYCSEKCQYNFEKSYTHNK